MQEERVEIGGVPARLYVPRGADGLLLLGHGGGRSKDASRFVNLSRVYAERTRLAVVCIDAVGAQTADRLANDPAGLALALRAADG